MLVVCTHVRTYSLASGLQLCEHICDFVHALIVYVPTGELWFYFECVATTILMCYLCCCCFLCLFCLWCAYDVQYFIFLKCYSFTSCKFCKSWFSKNLRKWEDCCFFWLTILCKTTWSVQDVLVKKWHMWDTMFQHACNICPLSVGQCCCGFKQIFRMCAMRFVAIF